MARPQLSGFASCLAILAVFLAVANAFPTVENFARLARRSGQSLSSESSIEELRALLVKLRSKRDTPTQAVDVSGNHAFQAPNLAGGDQRGPCPGINALANHGYISRDGVTGFVDAISASSEVLGMGADIAGILAILGTIDVGNPLSLNPGFSIGGKTPKESNVLGNLLGLLSTPGGLDASHNLLEVDGSGTRDDLYVTGDSWTLGTGHFEDMLNAVEGDVLTLDDGYEFALKRFQDSVDGNPCFFYGPVTGLFIRSGGFILPTRLMSNYSSEYLPDGQLTKANLMSFYGMVEENGQMVYKEGHEQIPANFYRRPTDYSLAEFNLDIVALALKYPELASIGGNLGTVNSFAGVDISDATGGVLNAASLLDGNNMVCFVLEAVKGFAPKMLGQLFSVLDVPLQLLDEVLAPVADLGCPAFGDLTMNGTDLYSGLLSTYPGAKKSGFAF